MVVIKIKNRKELNFYSVPSEITNLHKYKDFINWLSDDIPVIVQVLQGILIHGAWLKLYNLENRDELYYMNIDKVLDEAKKIDNLHLGISRGPEKKVVVSCREYAVLLCAILREKGIPARVRCGFVPYLAKEGLYEDHWICEYWNKERWVKVDAQIDAFQHCSLLEWATYSQDNAYQEIIHSLNPLDLSKDHFLSAGEAWLKCREKGDNPNRYGIYADPSSFGIGSLYGLWFIRGNLLRDYAALNKVETVPLLNRLEHNLSWKSWKLLSKNDEEVTNDELNLLDEIARMTLNVDEHLIEIKNTYHKYTDIQVPKEIL